MEQMEQGDSSEIEKDYEVLDKDYPNYDFAFKLIIIGNSGKKLK